MPAKMPKTAVEIVAEARPRIENLTTEQVAAEVAREELLVDLHASEEQDRPG